MLNILRNITLILLALSILGYILVVVRQKILLKNNIVFINKRSITEELLKRADLKKLSINGVEIKSGDEIQIINKENKKIEGILIGVSRLEGILFLISYEDKLFEFKLKEINSLKVISKYGHFF